MRKVFCISAIILALMFTSGCGFNEATKAGGDVVSNATATPEQRISLASKGGTAVALAYTNLGNPSVEKVQIARQVLYVISLNTNRIKEQGFSGSLVAINAIFDETWPKAEQVNKRIAAKQLATLLIEELDILFDKHPDWKDRETEIATLVSVFSASANSIFDSWLAAHKPVIDPN